MKLQKTLTGIQCICLRKSYVTSRIWSLNRISGILFYIVKQSRLVLIYQILSSLTLCTTLSKVLAHRSNSYKALRGSDM